MKISSRDGREATVRKRAGNKATTHGAVAFLFASFYDGAACLFASQTHAQAKRIASHKH